MARSPFPRSLKEVVEKASKPLIKKRGFSETKIIADWEQVVGMQLANAAIPIKIQFPKGSVIGGTLTLSTHPAYAPELQQSSPQILEKIASYFGYRAIERIVIEQTYRELASPTSAKTCNNTQATTINSDDPLLVALAKIEAARKSKE